MIINQEPYMYIIFIAIYYIEHASCGVEKNRWKTPSCDVTKWL